MNAKKMLLIPLAISFVSSCSVISQQVKSESRPTVAFDALVQEAERYKGKTVILGGYILHRRPEIKDLTGETSIEVLQTPLTFRDEPGSREHSRGKFIVRHKGILDPEVYSKDRKITVAGTLTGCKVGEIKICQMESREIYLWPEDKELLPYDYLVKDPRDWYEHHNRVYDQGLDKIYQSLPRLE